MFEKIAEIINELVGDAFTGADYDRGWHDALQAAANRLADCFRSENRFFDHSAFLVACGLQPKQSTPVITRQWKAVPYSDKTAISNPYAVATIVDGDGIIIADVFSQEAAALIATAPELKKRLSEYERDNDG